MKKLLAILLSLVLLLALAACGAQSESETEKFSKKENAPAVTSTVEQSVEYIVKEDKVDTNQTNEATVEDVPVEIEEDKQDDKQKDSTVKEFNIDDFCGTFTNDEGSEITFSKVGDGYQVTNIKLMVNGSMKELPDSRVASSDEIIDAVAEFDDKNMRRYEIYFNDNSEEAQGCILTFGEWDDGTITIFAWDTSMENWRTEGYHAYIEFSGVYK